VSDSTPHRCPRCNAAVDANQEYCLECGTRLPHQQRPGQGKRTSAGVEQRQGGAAAPWVVPALLGLVIAVLGTGAAIAISSEGDEPTAISTATGGSLTVTNDGSTLTAPEPTEPTTTAPATTGSKPTTTAKPPANPAAIVWPRDRRGWTIVLLSLPQSNGLAGANAKASQLRRGGLRRVGVLDSDRYASLHPSYYVIFTGIFDSEAEAASALQRARAICDCTAYQREIIP
jgi:cell division septation protein DedD